jgi:hypothetical protein
MLLVIGCREHVGLGRIGDVVSRGNDVFSIGAEHFQDIGLGAGLDGGGERSRRLVRTVEKLLRRGLLHRKTEGRDRGKANAQDRADRPS